MNFSNKSAWNQESLPIEINSEPHTPVRHVGRPNIVEIPISKLEDWIHDLDGVVDFDSPQELFDVVEQMRSYFRG